MATNLQDGAISWDGKAYPYKPAPEIDIDPRLRLHSAPANTESLDPITFEVIRARLWNINDEHADTIQRVSGSPIVVENYDFNTSITTEIGEPFLFGPYIQYFGAAAEYIVKYTLENRSWTPGIEPGDIFVHNDCFIGGSHQMDVGIYAPVFIDDELFCWVFNACHCRDVGGVEPGSFCITAQNIYYEAPMMRAAKLADANGIRGDIEDTFLRFSRLPDMLALELRSQIAGVTRARRRIEELADEFSADEVKATMLKLIEDTAAATRERLSRVPDGQWSDVIFCGGAFSGDREVHRTVVNLEKRGDRLFFNNFGTDPQVAAFNCGFGQWRAAIGCALVHMLAWDHQFCVGGVLRCVDFDAQVGTISTVDRDGAFSTLHPQLLTIFQAEKVIGKMLFPDPELREHLIATSMGSTVAVVAHAGVDQWGNPFATATLDHSAGGFGASAGRDGIDQGGNTFWPKSEIADCESSELFYPILYLYRRASLNCGHGKHRGGNGIAFALIGHGTEEQIYVTISVTSSTPVSAGVFGGHFASTGLFYGIEGSDVRERFASGDLPSTPGQIRTLSGEHRALPAKTGGMRFLDSDVIEEAVYGGGGYGDPLERVPSAVVSDVQTGQVSRDLARRVYGVVLDDDQEQLNVRATEARRDAVRAERLQRSQAPSSPPPDATGDRTPVIEIAEALRVDSLEGGGYVIVCQRCDTVLCSADANYKDHVRSFDGQLTEINPDVFIDPDGDVDADVVYRSYVCPGCATLLENELTLRDEPPVWDIQIDIASIQRTEDGQRASSAVGLVPGNSATDG